MSLIDRYLPRHQFSEEHSRYIPAPPARVLDVLGRQAGRVGEAL